MVRKATERMGWMDLLRGSAIVLVIVNHAVLFANGQPGGAPIEAEVVNAIFAPLRMPLMVFLSGLLLAKSLAKPTRVYVRGKARQVLYPYVLWSLIVIGIDGATNLVSGGTVPWSDFGRIITSPLAHLWFLYYLIGYYAIALVSKRLNPLWISGASLILCAVLPEPFHRFFLLMLFFMLGKWASQANLWKTNVNSRIALIIASVVSIGFVVAAIFGLDLRYSAMSVPFVIAGIIVSINVAQASQNRPVANALQRVGLVSIVYYLGHWYGVIVGTKLAAEVFPGSPWLTIVGGLVGGFALAVAAHVVYLKVPGGRWLFEMPRRSPLSSSAAARKDQPAN
jgi:fucose 4-O-acetylase-like acetyltransferase